eukprot:CAMPEP_0201919856 /NCGR_PEP_ID=MMETSP0903-20130614/8623_1 /ASSEMBLY_ACC=CAM_ASM_000552 /TAXON_ID=420261 /ORGANISM="Thalassiosira antarctica, Strain CCMP982" /LENGTH=53 /DNA_ID=CAMNT_0048456471 /DNA_START=59 /DNA_END=220 /DNA_ORIENTATION=+
MWLPPSLQYTTMWWWPPSSLPPQYNRSTPNGRCGLTTAAWRTTVATAKPTPRY